MFPKFTKAVQARFCLFVFPYGYVKAGGICKQILVPNLPNSFRRQWRYNVHIKSNYNTEIQSRQVI